MRRFRQPLEKRDLFQYLPRPYAFSYRSLNLESFALAHDTREKLELKAAVFHWTRLDLFTGSRVSEYAETYLRVPTTAATNIWAGSQVAFLSCDFILLDEKCPIHWSESPKSTPH
jgi:hypothetical protein